MTLIAARCCTPKCVWEAAQPGREFQSIKAARKWAQEHIEHTGHFSVVITTTIMEEVSAERQF